MWTLPKSLRISIQESAKPDQISSDDQIGDSLSSGSGEPADALAFNSPFSPFGSQWGSPMFASASLESTQHGGGTVTPLASHTVASAPVAAASAHSAVVADGRVASPGGSGLVFNNSFDSSCTAQFEACVVAAEKTLEGLFTNPAVFNVSFSEQNQGNNGDAAENSAGGEVLVQMNPPITDPPDQIISYAALKSALPSTDVLPSSLPGGYLDLPEAYARMLGLNSNKPSTDASVTYNTHFSSDFGQDVVNVIMHELTENLMGRVGGLGDPGNVLGIGGLRSTMDLFRYTAAGTPDYSDGRDGQVTFFSSDGGKTTSEGADLSFNNEYNASGNQVNQGDTADFGPEKGSSGTEFGANPAVFGFANAGETITLTQTELNVMEALGWKAQISQDCFTGSGNWQTPTNWTSSVNDGATPIEPQDAYIGANYADIAAAATSLDDIIVNTIGTNAASTLVISGRSTLTATNGTVLNPSDRFTTAIGNNGTITVEDTSQLSVGNSFDSTGSLIVENTSGFFDTGAFVNSGAFTVEGADLLADFGGAVDNSGSIAVGVGASAELDGAVTNKGTVTVGAQRTDDGVTGVLSLLGATTFSGGGAIDMGQITVGFNTDIVAGGGGGGLGGGGHIVTYESSGDIFGGSALVNVDDAISGAGLISVNSFDNQAAASAGASFAGHALQIESSAIHNEGELFADAQTTLYLDLTGPSAWLVNSGQIDLAAGADLEVNDNLTDFGSGSINFNGAGAALTSDGFEPTTFTNENSIVATASAQIGDVGIKSANDLTLVDYGSIIADGSGVTLTLDTGVNTIVDAGGLFEAEAGAELTIDSPVKTGHYEPITGGPPPQPHPSTSPAPQSTIEASSGGVVNINATIFDGATGSNQVNGRILINGGTVNVAAGVSLGVPVAFTGAGGTLNLTNAPNDVVVNGAGGAINLSHANADVTGGGFTVNETGVDWIAIGGNGAGGATDVVNGSGDTTTTHSASNVTIVGSHDTVDVGVRNALSLEGANDVVNLQELFGDMSLSGFAASDVLQLSKIDFADFQALQSHMTQSGANTLITLDAHDVIKLTNVAASSSNGVAVQIRLRRGGRVQRS